LYLKKQMSEARMSLRHAISIFTITLLVAGLCATASGQNGNGNGNGSGNSRRAFDRIPQGQKYLEALGRRGRAVGKEKTVYTGQLFDKKGKSTPVRIIHQLPNLVRLEGFQSGNGHLSFDGEKAHGINSKKEEAYLETFAMDMAEGMLASMQSNAAIRFLGSGFGPDPRKVPNYTGPRYDIIDVLDTVRCSKENVKRLKSYYLDTKTGLLESTRYKDQTANPPVAVETRFSTWGTIDGSAYPARIDRYEGGELEFTFIAEEITVESSTDVESFK
jgi:hypothetical protein